MKNTLYLDSLHIKDEYKGKEVGTKIINHLKKYAREKEYKGVSVSIMSGNDRARNQELYILMIIITMKQSVKNCIGSYFKEKGIC